MRSGPICGVSRTESVLDVAHVECDGVCCGIDAWECTTAGECCAGTVCGATCCGAEFDTCSPDGTCCKAGCDGWECGTNACGFVCAGGCGDAARCERTATGSTCVCDTPCGEACCGAGESCFDGVGCCASASVCYGACCPVGAVCMGPEVGCCDTMDTCGGACCDISEACIRADDSGELMCCPDAQACESPFGDVCCQLGEVCKAGSCCAEERVCGYDCCAEGAICIDDVDNPLWATCCERQCAHLECGDDGCGGSCGTCPDGGVCDEGHCPSADCEPACSADRGETCLDGLCCALVDGFESGTLGDHPEWLVPLHATDMARARIVSWKAFEGSQAFQVLLLPSTSDVTRLEGVQCPAWSPRPDVYELAVSPMQTAGTVIGGILVDQPETPVQLVTVGFEDGVVRVHSLDATTGAPISEDLGAFEPWPAWYEVRIRTDETERIATVDVTGPGVSVSGHEVSYDPDHFDHIDGITYLAVGYVQSQDPVAYLNTHFDALRVCREP